MKRRSAAVPAALVVILFIALLAVLKLAAGIVMPLVIALLLSFALTPLLKLLMKLRIPRNFAIALVVLSLLGLGFLSGLVLYSSVTSLVNSWPLYQTRLTALFHLLTARLGVQADLLSQPQVLRSIGSYLIDFFGSFVKFSGSFILMLIFLVFMFLERRFIRRKLYRAVQEKHTDTVLRVMKDVTQQIRRYLAVKVFVSLCVGAAVWISFIAIGIDFAFVWAVLSFLFNFVPAFGSLAVGIVAILFSIVQYYPEWNPVIACAGAVVFVQVAFGSILEPMLLGDNLNLSPVVVLFSLLVWSWIWGPIGMLIAVPLAVAIKITFASIPALRFVSVLMGTGRLPRAGPPKPSASEPSA
ncbi:AI-2E family transporter [Salinispira pacifica]